MSYAYLAGSSLLGVVWLVFFLLRKDLRHQQILVSLFSAPLAPVSEILWFYKDYWRPGYVWPVYIHGVPIGIEEILFAFFIGGVGSVVYEVIFRRKFTRGRPRIFLTFALLVLTAFLFLVLKAFNLETIWASAVSLAAGAVSMVVIDRDLRADLLMSSIAMFVLVTALYLVLFSLYHQDLYRLWTASAFSGFRFLGIPIEELAWFVSWAMFSGVVYEFMVNAGPYGQFKSGAHRRAKI